MRFERVILRVSDLDASVEFWTEWVGLKLVGKGGPFAFVDGGGAQLTLNQVDELPDDGWAGNEVTHDDTFADHSLAELISEKLGTALIKHACP